MRPLLVVGEAEGVELGLQLGEVGRRRLPPEPALEGLVEALDLALGLGMARRPVLLADAEVGEQVLEAVAAAGEARRVDRPLSVSVAAGQPWASPAAVNVATTSSPATRRKAVQPSR